MDPTVHSCTNAAMYTLNAGAWGPRFHYDQLSCIHLSSPPRGTFKPFQIEEFSIQNEFIA